MFFPTVIAALTALSAVRAQSTYAQEVDIAGVKAGFEGEQITSLIIASVCSIIILILQFNLTWMTIAAALTPTGMLPDFQPQAVIHAMFSGSESPLGFPRTTNRKRDMSPVSLFMQSLIGVLLLSLLLIETIPFPYLTIEPAVNATSLFTQDSMFTLTLIDCDIVGTNLAGTLVSLSMLNKI